MSPVFFCATAGARLVTSVGTLFTVATDVPTLMVFDQAANRKTHKGGDYKTQDNVGKHYTVTFSFFGVSSRFGAEGLRNRR